jgi:hypothetical protein
MTFQLFWKTYAAYSVAGCADPQASGIAEQDRVGSHNDFW